MVFSFSFAHKTLIDGFVIICGSHKIVSTNTQNMLKILSHCSFGSQSNQHVSILCVSVDALWGSRSLARALNTKRIHAYIRIIYTHRRSQKLCTRQMRNYSFSMCVMHMYMRCGNTNVTALLLERWRERE